ncbi:MAG: hypothetical protein RBT49_17040 [Bacteroidales bacterium]|jgi:hypothetical protein|nr:hypothetical protein [Bacteroidales bacterium]
MNKFDNIPFKDFKSIKEYTDNHLQEIAFGTLRINNIGLKVRYIDLETMQFGYTGLGYFFFFDETMYIITKDEKYRKAHNQDIIGISDELDWLRYTNDYIVRVIFAGVFTGFYDDIGERIFTGDFVQARILIKPSNPSTGWDRRASDITTNHPGQVYRAGVYVVMDQFVLFLDNHSLPLSWATKLKVLGSFFYNLEPDTTSVDIRQLCSQYAQSHTNINEMIQLVKRSPSFEE